MYKHIFRRLPLYRNTNYHVWMRGIYGLLRSRIFKKPSLKYMDVALDYSCNMNCAHCFAKTLKGDREKKLSIEQYHKIAEDARSIGCLHFNLQGGEPLLMKNLPEYIKAFRPHLCHVSITTNGYLFSEEKALMLKKAGVKQIVFSLDSLDPKQHDDFRRLKGAYSRVIEGIMLAKRVQFSVSVNVTVSHQSLQSEEQRRLFDWLHKEKIPYNPILACPVGAWTGRTDIMVSHKDVAFINSLRDKYSFAQRDIHSSWVKEGCSAISETMYLTPYGDVLPCPFIHISVGNVHEEGIDKIWRRLMSENIYGQYYKKCWVAEDETFVNDLTCLYSKYDSLPISHNDPEGYRFLARYWKNMER